MDEARLIERLRAIEALHAGATTPGERAAAERGRDRILERLRSFERVEPSQEFQFSLPDVWTRKVFLALLRRWGVRPYRYPRQRRTTVMARVPKRFLDETLWPEFQELSRELTTYLAEATERVLNEAFHSDGSEAEVVPLYLESGPEGP